MANHLRFSSIVLMTLASVASTISISASYSFAQSVLFYDMAICLLFFLPASIIVCKFTAECSKNSGIYFWVTRGLGWRAGAIAILLQWLAHVFYYPIALLFILVSIAQVLNYSISPLDLFFGINIIFWGLTYINIKGIKHSSRWIEIATALGLFLPLLILAVATLCSPYISHTQAPLQLPCFNIMSMRDPLLVTFSAFVGVEINAIHANSVQNPSRTIPLAILTSAGLIVLCIVGGTWLMLTWLPPSGVQASNAFADALLAAMQSIGLESLSLYVILLMLLGPLGGIIACILSPAQALNQCIKSIMPSKSKLISTFNLLIAQAILVTLLSLLNFIFDINQLFNLMIDVMVALYLLMYILMFVSALYTIRPKEVFISNFMTRVCCVLGLTTCVSCYILCFWKPEADLMHYASWVALMFIACIMPYMVLLRKNSSFNMKDETV